MKFPRILATFLILVMASSQALATVCATNCSAPDIQRSTSKVMQQTKGMSAEHHQHSMPSKDDHRYSQEAGICGMAGCNLVQVATFERMAVQQVYDLSGTVPALRTPVAVSADTPPPIKPPA